MIHKELFKNLASKKDEYRIIDEFTHQHLETLNGEKAIEKYGDYICYGWYTVGFTDAGGFKADVWVWKNKEDKNEI